MSYDVPDPNDLLKCPYDNTHMVVAKRFPYHLMKCRKNYTGRDFAVCPFHAYHEVPRPELRHHMLHCPYRGMLHKDLKLATVKQEDDAFKGNTSVPAYKPDWHQDPNEETWDEEPFEPYIPQRSVPSEPPMPQMRLPREAPQVLQQAAAMPHQEEPQAREQPTKVFNYSLSMAGIGRGRRHKTAENPGGPAVNGDQGSNAGKSGRGRIAANIYGGLQQETNGTANQVEQAARPVPIGRGRGRGLGRGLAQPNGHAVGAYAMQNGVPNR